MKYFLWCHIWTQWSKHVKLCLVLGVGVSGVDWALFRFELLACYHPNLGIFGGVLLIQKKISSKNEPYAGQITFWKYNRKSIFWLFLNIDQNASKKIRIEIWTFSFQICFWNHSWTSGSSQTKNPAYRRQSISQPMPIIARMP